MHYFENVIKFIMKIWEFKKIINNLIIIFRNNIYVLILFLMLNIIVI